jgi:hypothetical protein
MKFEKSNTKGNFPITIGTYKGWTIKIDGIGLFYGIKIYGNGKGGMATGAQKATLSGIEKWIDKYGI